MFPLGSVLFPGADLPLQVFEPRYVEMIKHCTDTDSPQFGVVLIARGSEVGGDDVRTDVGTLARIQASMPLAPNRFALNCRGEDRIRVVRWLPDEPFPRAEIELWPDVPDGDDMDALATVVDKRSEMQSIAREVAKRSGKRFTELPALKLPDEPSARSFTLAAGLPLSEADRQRALAANGPAERLGVLANALDDVIAVLRFRLM